MVQRLSLWWRNCIVFMLLSLTLVIVGYLKKNYSTQGIHVVWIVIDSLRPDHLGCYGYGRNTSPFIDKLAKDNILFEYAFCPETYTQASVSSCFTSTYPWVHNCLYDEPTIDTLDPRLITIAEVLKENHYRTAAFVFNPHLNARYNFWQGFDIYDDDVQNISILRKTYSDHETAGKIYTKVQRYLRSIKDKRPVFLYLHYRDVHTPYVPPSPYNTMFLAPLVASAQSPNRQATNPDIEREISMYDGAIRFTDDYLKKTLRMLERYGIYTSNSIIIITADHGEELYDQRPHDPGSIGHGRTLYMELIRVPLIISIPGSSYRRKSISTYVQLLDIAPTILDVLHIKHDGYGQFQGRSLLPVIDGTDVTALPVYGGARHGRGYIIKNGYKYYIDQQDKTATYKRPATNDYIYNEELYDIKNDFFERKNIIAAYPSVAAELREDLNLFKKRTASGHGTSLPMELDQQAKDELKSLGYL